MNFQIRQIYYKKVTIRLIFFYTIISQKTQKLKKNQKKSATTGLRRRGQRLLRRARDRSGIREDGRRREMEPARVRLRRVERRKRGKGKERRKNSFEKRKRKEEDDIFWGRKEGEGEQRKASLTAFSLFPASEFLV